jgi:hypothetical protein
MLVNALMMMRFSLKPKGWLEHSTIKNIACAIGYTCTEFGEDVCKRGQNGGECACFDAS